MANRVLQWIFTGRDQSLSSTSHKASANVSKDAKSMSGAMSAFSLVSATAAAYVGKNMIQAAMDFAGSMTKIVSLVGVSQKTVNAWASDLMKLGPQVGKSPKELADALYFITSAGLRGQKAIDVLTMSAKASAAGLGETKVVADAVTSAVNAYATTGLKASTVTDVMVAAVREGKMPVDALAGSLGQVLPIASEVGVSFQEVAGTGAVLSRVGAPVEKTMIGIKYLLTQLIRPSGQAEKALKGVGLSADSIRTSIQQRGLLPTLQMLKDRMPIDEFLKVVGGARGVITALGLVGKNATMAASVMGKVKDSTDSTNRAFEVTSKTAGFKMKQALAAIQAAGIQVGGALLPIVAQISTAIATIVMAFQRLPGPVRVAIAALAGFVVLVTVFAKVKKAVIELGLAMKAAQAGNVWLLVAAAIAMACYLIITNWDKIKAVTIKVWNAIKNFVVGVWQHIYSFLTEIWNSIVGTARSIWASVTGIFTTVLGAVTGAFSRFGGMISGIFSTAVRAVVAGIRAAFAPIAAVYAMVVGFFDRIRNFIVTSFTNWWASNGEAIKRIWNAVWTAVTAVFRFVWGQIVAAARGYWALLVAVFNIGKAIIMGVWNAIWPVMKAVFQAFWVFIQAQVKIGWLVVKTAFDLGKSIVMTIWNSLWAVLRAAFNVAWAAITTAIKIGWTIILTAFNIGKATIVAVWNVLWTTLKTVFNIIWSSIRTILKIGWDLIVGIFTVFINLITGRWGAAWNALKNMFVQIWNAIRAHVSLVFSQIWGLIQTILRNIAASWSASWNAIKGFFSNIWNSMYSFVRTSLSNLWNAITSAIGNVVNFFKGVPGKILAAIGSLGRLLWNTGKDIISGLFNGVVEALKSVRDWVKAHIFDPIVGAIKWVFGISSPARSMFTMGANMVKGLILGIIKSNPAKFVAKAFGSTVKGLAALVGKGIVQLAKLPKAALSALSKAGSAVWGGIKSIGGAIASFFGGGKVGVTDITGWLTTALVATGTDLNWLSGLVRLVQAESGGNPRAVNPTPVGTEHATGLLQTLPSTFRAYAIPGLMDILNPVHNAIAAIRYIKARYGSVYNTPLFKGGGYVGYAEGTRSAKRGWAWVGEGGVPELVHFGGGEAVAPYVGGRGGNTVNVYVTVRGHALASKQEIAREVSDALTVFKGKGGNV